MMTALYVFIGILAAFLVLYIFDEIVTFIRSVKRKLKENDETEFKVERTPYNGYYGMRGSYYGGLNDWELTKIKNKLNNLEEKIDQILEDTGELMLAKEHPEE